MRPESNPPTPRHRGRPPRMRTDAATPHIEFSSAARELCASLQLRLQQGETVLFQEGELAAIWDGEGDRHWRLLRLHRFARDCGATFSRETDGRFRFSSAPRENRPPHYQFVATLTPKLAGQAPPAAERPTRKGLDSPEPRAATRPR